ncbi:MAG: hypothetical protein WCO06_00530 [Candidatus Roizmanbacteria bacterium]
MEKTLGSIIGNLKHLSRKQRTPILKKGKYLVVAQGNQRFWLSDGQVLSDMLDLLEVLRKMSEETYKKHVNQEKNDFAEWIGNVLHDRICAIKLRKAHSLNDSVKVLEENLLRYR